MLVFADVLAGFGARRVRRGGSGRGRRRRRFRCRGRIGLFVELRRAALADHLRRRLRDAASCCFITSPIGTGCPSVSMTTCISALVTLIAHVDGALRERDIAELEIPRRRFGGLLELERPVVAVVLEPLDIDRRIHEIDRRNHDVVREQRQHGHLKVDFVERCEEFLTRPVRIRDGDFFSGEARPRHPAFPARFVRRTTPADFQIPRDFEAAADRFGHFVIHPGSQTVPVECQEYDHQYCDQNRQNGKKPCDDPSDFSGRSGLRHDGSIRFF